MSLCTETADVSVCHRWLSHEQPCGLAADLLLVMGRDQHIEQSRTVFGQPMNVQVCHMARLDDSGMDPVMSLANRIVSVRHVDMGSSDRCASWQFAR